MKQPETDSNEHNERYGEKMMPTIRAKSLLAVSSTRQGFKKPDGSLDSAAMADEMFKWAQSKFKKIDDPKKAEADATVDEK